MQPYLKGIGVGILGTALIGGIALGTYLFKNNTASNEDITRELNNPPPAATSSAPAQTYPITVSPTTPASPEQASPKPSPKPRPPKKPAQYKEVDVSYIASKVGWKLVFDSGRKLDISRYSDFRGIAGDFNGDGLEDLGFIGWGVRPEYGTKDVDSLVLENTGIGYKPIPSATGHGSSEPDYGQLFLRDILVVDINSDGLYEFVTSVVVYNDRNNQNVMGRTMFFHSFNDSKIGSGHYSLRLNEEPLFWDMDGDGVDELIAINRFGDPIRVFALGPDKSYVNVPNPVIGTRIMDTVKDMAKTLTTPSFSIAEKEARIADTIQRDPYVGTISVSIIGGFDLDKYLKEHQQDVGRAVTETYSSMVRGLFMSGLEDIASGNYAAGLAKGLIGTGLGEVAKIQVGGMLQGTQIFTDSDGNRWERTTDGLWKYLGK